MLDAGCQAVRLEEPSGGGSAKPGHVTLTTQHQLQWPRLELLLAHLIQSARVTSQPARTRQRSTFVPVLLPVSQEENLPDGDVMLDMQLV